MKLMKLRKLFVSLVVLTLTLGICAACRDTQEPDEDTTYTVAFYDGETKVSSVEVEAGNALKESDIPAAPGGHQSEVFLGWFVGETEVEAGYTPTASVTAKAKFQTSTAEKYTVTIAASNDFTVTGLKNEYSAGEKVTFTISVTNASKQLDEVTSADVTIALENGAYQFTMPAKNVTVTVTLKAADPQGGGSSDPKDEVDERIHLFMYGDLYPGHSRSIYATLDGLSGDLEWSSDDINVVNISTSENAILQGDMPEAFLHANTTGTATIRCTLKSNIKIFNEYKITVKDPTEGTPMPTELYEKLEGSLKLTSTEQLLDYDTDYQATASETYDITTIFEENHDEDITINTSGDMANLSDAFQIEVKYHDSGTVKFTKRFVSDQRNVCTEYVKMDNTVGRKPVFKEDAEGSSETLRWATSYYSNIFYARPSYSAPELWKSFDGGKTYHYVGGELSATILCAFFYQEDISPDDMYFEVENGEIVKFTVEIDPANYKSSQKFGRKIETTFSDFGTAAIEHLEPFATESYHAGLKTAIEKMAALKNYKAVMSFNGNTYEITYLADTIDVVVKNGTGKIIRHTGAHKYGDGEGDGKTYFEYTYNDETKELTKGDEHDTPWEGAGTDGKTIVRYPTFNFAAEIFAQASGDKTFVSRINNGEFVKETCYLSVISDAYGMWDFSADGTLKLDSSGQYIEEVSATVTILGDEDTISIVFSAYNEATVDIQFTEAVTPAEPSTWEEGLSKVQENLTQTLYDVAVEYNIPLAQMPYVNPEVGFDAVGRINRSGGQPRLENAIKIETAPFADTNARDAYIALYKAALEAAGWTATGTKEEVSKMDLYEKDGVDFKIGIVSGSGWGQAEKQVYIGVFECTTLNLGD